MQPARRRLTVAEFFDECPNDGRHYQLIDGVIVAMAPPGSRHQVIAGNLGGLLYNAVTNHRPGCSVRTQAGIAPMGMFGRDHFEADFAITCGLPAEGDRGMVAQPILIVEILSPSNDRDDVLVKLPIYKTIPGLDEIVYVESETVAASVYRRGTDGTWLPEERLHGPAARLRLNTIGLDVPLAIVHARALPGV